MPSISDRLRSAQRNPANKGGCVSCKWLQQISDETRRLINEWIDNDYSIKQLYDILSAPNDSGEPPLPISLTGWRLHMNHHNDKRNASE